MTISYEKEYDYGLFWLLYKIALEVQRQINANYANGDNFSFTIVDEGSKGKLGNLNPTKTVT